MTDTVRAVGLRVSPANSQGKAPGFGPRQGCRNFRQAPRQEKTKGKNTGKNKEKKTGRKLGEKHTEKTQTEDKGKNTGQKQGKNKPRGKRRGKIKAKAEESRRRTKLWHVFTCQRREPSPQEHGPRSVGPKGRQSVRRTDQRTAKAQGAPSSVLRKRGSVLAARTRAPPVLLESCPHL